MSSEGTEARPPVDTVAKSSVQTRDPRLAGLVAREPKGGAWIRSRFPVEGGGFVFLNQKVKLQAISSLTVLELPDGSGELGPQWHVSFSSTDGRRAPVRPGEHQIVYGVRAFFGDLKPEEDNHHPGKARHFFLPVDPARRVDCECKATETTVVDGSYRWTNPTPGAGPCRGCELETIMASRRLPAEPCPIHGKKG